MKKYLKPKTANSLIRALLVCFTVTGFISSPVQARSSNIADYIMYTNVEKQSRAIKVGHYECTYKNQNNGQLVSINLNKYCPKIMYYYKRDGYFYETKG